MAAVLQPGVLAERDAGCYMLCCVLVCLSMCEVSLSYLRLAAGFTGLSPEKASKFHSAADAWTFASPVIIETTQGELCSWSRDLLSSRCFCRSGKKKSNKQKIATDFPKSIAGPLGCFQGKAESCQPYGSGFAPCAPLPKLCPHTPLPTTSHSLLWALLSAVGTR